MYPARLRLGGSPHGSSSPSVRSSGTRYTRSHAGPALGKFPLPAEGSPSSASLCLRWEEEERRGGGGWRRPPQAVSGGEGRTAPVRLGSRDWRSSPYTVHCSSIQPRGLTRGQGQGEGGGDTSNTSPHTHIHSSALLKGNALRRKQEGEGLWRNKV